MQRRSLTSIIVLIALVVVIGLFAWFNNRSGEEETVAFAPARSTDEPLPEAETPESGAGQEIAATSPGDGDGDGVDGDEGGQELPKVEILSDEQTVDEPIENDATTVADTDADGNAGQPETEVVDATSEPLQETVEDVLGDATEIVDGAVDAVQDTVADAMPQDAVSDDGTAGDGEVASVEGPEADPAPVTEAGPETDVAMQTPSDSTDGDTSSDATKVRGNFESADSGASGDQPAGDVRTDETQEQVAAIADNDGEGANGEVTDTPTPTETVVADGMTDGTDAATGQGGGEDTEIALAEPTVEPTDTVDQATAPAMPTVIPTFDIVRVEPSGDVVIAGQAEPESSVEVLDGPEVLATAKANDRGEWALVLDEPLQPGPHDLAIRTTSRSIATLSDERVAVSVPERGESDVLVVLNTPDAASEVLQVPEADKPAGGDETVVALAPDGATDDAAVDAPPVEDATTADDQTAPPADTNVADTTGGEPAGDDTAQQVATSVNAQDDADGATTGDGAPADTTVATAGDGAEPTGEVVTDAPIEVAEDEKPATETVVAAVEPEPEPEPEPVIRRSVTVTAVEADTAGALFVTGTAATDESVRVYVDNDLIGQTQPMADGLWQVEVQREMPPGQYAIRADQTDPTGDVLVRAEVPFEREVTVAALEAPAPAAAPAVEDATDGSAEIAAAPTTQVAGELPNLKTVIIQRGDNLWRISRKIYGRGIRYSTIYEANRDQIGNPKWIYPGQVFVLPEGNTEWSE